ncbi:hypothetical protein AVEN_252605-1 [Araneus ventricosus]|uniref:Uncharacterized protein n=1 Tax=Araneus ventricosus TaxID=182803 RepID=A0A4Y2ARJ0_ARAVE|nr:hypothetical protein AVEN_252605-1 [Araneus ventricosus]
MLDNGEACWQQCRSSLVVAVLSIPVVRLVGARGGYLAAHCDLQSVFPTCPMGFRSGDLAGHAICGMVKPHQSCSLRAGVIVHKYGVGTHCSDKRPHKRV